jgi:hypothetical protein
VSIEDDSATMRQAGCLSRSEQLCLLCGEPVIRKQAGVSQLTKLLQLVRNRQLWRRAQLLPFNLIG